MSTYQAYVSDPAVRRRSWRARRDHPAWRAEPNRAHTALAGLARSGLVTSVITQNIDGLHQKAGNSPKRVIEVHGTVHGVVCLSCGWKGSMQATLARVRAGESDPPCERCGGILKSDTISFGQALVPEVIDRAMQAAADADLLISVGTSLRVYPIAGAVPAAKNAGARVVIVNAEATPFDGIADAVLRGAIGETLPRIVGIATVPLA
jgi:NAD-dependent deacetylase